MGNNNFPRMVGQIESVIKGNTSKNEVINNRIIECEEEYAMNNPTTNHIGGVVTETYTHKGYIPQNTGIVTRIGLPKFYLDDSSIYSELIDNIKNMSDNEYDTDTIRNTVVPAIQETVDTYFGLTGNSRERAEIYMEHFDKEMATGTDQKVSVSEFKKNGTGLCTERAAVAQNLFSFVGIDSEFVIANLFHHEKSDIHAFNIVSNRKDDKMLIDVTNPALIFNENGKLQDHECHLEPLTNEDYNNIKNNGIVTVSHIDYMVIGDRRGERVQQFSYGQAHKKVNSKANTSDLSLKKSNNNS